MLVTVVRQLVLTLLVVGLVPVATSCRHDRLPVDLTLDQVFDNPQTRALAMAGARGDTGQVDELLARGCAVDSPGRYGITPLWWAVRSNNYAGVVHLLEQGADPNVKIEADRESIIQSAAMMDDSRILQAVLAKNGSPDLKSAGSKRTPIFSAILSDKTENLKLLIDAGADLNHQDGVGATAAMNAAMVRDYEKALLLLKHGADPAIRDKLGRTLKDIVRERGRHDRHAEEILRMLAQGDG